MKFIFCILRLLLARNLMLFIDKATLGYAVLLGLMEETHIDYSGLIPLRLFFGLVEATVIPALEMAMIMFFTPKDLHALQPVSWIACFGCPIPIGLLGYTLLFSKSLFFYPSNPMTTQFLSTEEKVHIIRRVQAATRSAIDQKQSLLYLQLGVSDLGSTLVWVAAGGFAMVVAVVSSLSLKLWPNYSAYWATLWCFPAVAGGIGMVAFPWDRMISLLACLLLACNTWGMSYIIPLGCAASSCAGNDSLIIRWILARRNKERYAWIEEQVAAGNLGTGVVEVSVSTLDLADLESICIFTRSGLIH
ncbi:hypothetical protein BDV23DRAFT_174779 [Aspergillus alliaceus]|uniref:Major facilitator superfamily domain-containing protein n=1 Tax=Petromyces alliaceus TaxID=209559 RepID=A0A5N7BZN9_PETAA|nr:hypothetical protein BDV23DRAFT_174779 [Aspergillus alliaceus]